MRGRIAIFNERVREIADRHGATLVDFWRMRDYRDAGADGHRPDAPQQLRPHQHMAIAVLDALGVEHDLDPVTVEPRSPSSGAARPGPPNAQWTREFLVPGCTAGSPAARPATPSRPKRPALAPACDRRSGSPV